MHLYINIAIYIYLSLYIYLYLYIYLSIFHYIYIFMYLYIYISVYVQAVLKIGAPGDVSSVGGTPGVWCLNVIGRECWVWVVPCTGSWPGQPPPTKWGKEP